jgi:hypothetical protein
MGKIWIVIAVLFALGAVPTFAPSILHCTESANKPFCTSVRTEHRETPPAQVDETEYWPTVFGVKLKITDSLLALFTLGLWISTNQLWKSGERQAAFTQGQLKLAQDEFNYVHRPRLTVRREQVRFNQKDNGINLVLVNGLNRSRGRGGFDRALGIG